jgi:hypothetical protein
VHVSAPYSLNTRISLLVVLRIGNGLSLEGFGHPECSQKGGLR